MIFITILSCEDKGDTDSTPPKEFSLTEPEDRAIINDSVVTLKWNKTSDNNSDIVTYRLYFGDKNEKNQPLIAIYLTENSYELKNLESSKYYSWRVEAVDNYGNYFATDNYSIYVNTIPESFKSVHPQKDQLVYFNTFLSWEIPVDKDNDILKYDIYLGKDSLNLNRVIENLDISDNYIIRDTLNNPAVLLNNLDFNETYFWKILVKDNYGGEKESKIKSFKVIDQKSQDTGIFEDLRDGNIYRWVKIGSDVWMAENLRFKNKLLKEYPVYFNTYGRFYKWDEVVKGEKYDSIGNGIIQGICPDGWRLPNESDILQLIHTSNNDIIHDTLFNTFPYWETDDLDEYKAPIGWKDINENTNLAGFNAIATGLFENSSNQKDLYKLNASKFWTTKISMKWSAGNAYSFNIGKEVSSYSASSKFQYFSVRCVKRKY